MYIYAEDSHKGVAGQVEGDTRGDSVRGGFPDGSDWRRAKRARERWRESDKSKKKGLRQKRERGQSECGLRGCRCLATQHTQHPRGEFSPSGSHPRIQSASKVIAPSRVLRRIFRCSETFIMILGGKRSSAANYGKIEEEELSTKKSSSRRGTEEKRTSRRNNSGVFREARIYSYGIR